MVRLYGKICSRIRVLLFLSMFAFSAYVSPAEGSVCFSPDELFRPKVSEIISLSEYFSESIENRVKSILDKLYGTEDPVAVTLRRYYVPPQSLFMFFSDELNQTPAISILKDFVNYYVFYENISFRELVEIDHILRRVEFLKTNLLKDNPGVNTGNKPFLCASGHIQQGFYITGTEIPPDQQQLVLAWAGRQLRKIEELTGTLIEADVLLTALLVRYCLTTRPTRLPELPDKATVHDPAGIREYLLSLHPSNDHYRTLIERIAFYRDLSGQTQIFLKDSTTLRQGMTGHLVLTLQKRLNQEGFLGDTAINGIFDERTYHAVVTFQALHNLEQDGVVGPRTRAALNIPYAVKLRWIRESLRRMRLFLDGKEETMVWANIPTFSLEYYRQGILVSRHKIVVGRASGEQRNIRGVTVRINNTLPLASEIKAVVINPRWYVPERIRKELEEEIAARPDYLERENFRYLSSQYSWGEPRIYQLPGETNPLGRVKFLFDNPFGIFLHDTSQPKLFSRAYRAFSHGCVRVENALNLARQILSDAAPHQLSRLEGFLARKDQTYIVLTRAVPIYITYLPVLSDGKGKLHFGGDPYGWGIDERLPAFFYKKRKP